MHKTFRGQLRIYTIAAFMIIFLLILFVAVQGRLYGQIVEARNDFRQHAQNAALYLKEEAMTAAAAENTDEYEYFLTKHANILVKQISRISAHRTILLNSEGTVLSDSNSNASQDMDFTAVSTLVQDKQQPVYTLTDFDQKATFIYAAPLELNGTILFYIAFAVPFESLNDPATAIISYFILGFILCIPLILIFIRKISGFSIKPIVDLTNIAHKINEGHYDVSISYPLKDEIGELTETFNTMIQNTGAAIRQLHLERDRLSDILASLDDGLLALDREGNIITANAHIKIFFNIANPKNIYDFQFQTFLQDIFEDLKSGHKHVSMEIDCSGRDLMIIGSPIGTDGIEENYMLVIRNMTAANRIKQDQQKFISSVSHELRTPLTTIIGYTDMILRRHLSENDLIIQSLTTINKEGHRLLRLVDDLLDMNRLDTPEFSVKKTILNLHELLTEVIEQMKIRALEKDVDILYKSDFEEMTVLGDYDRLQQVFINIIHNAIKYSNPGAIVDITATSEEDRILISVRDYGIGIAETEQKKIFSAFYRVEEDRARNEGEGGAGLGLYLVRQIIIRHQGNIDIQSIQGEGTNIVISLPVLSENHLGGGQDEK